MARPARALEQAAERAGVDGDRRRGRRGRSRPAAGREDQVDAGRRSSSRSALERAGVAVEVLGRAELQRVDEDRHRDARRPACPRDRISSAWPVVQRAHGHHQRDRAGHRRPARRPARPGCGPSSVIPAAGGLGTRGGDHVGRPGRRRSCTRGGRRRRLGRRPARRAAGRRLAGVSRPAAMRPVGGPPGQRRVARHRVRRGRRAPPGGRPPCRRRRGRPGRSARRRRSAARCPARRAAAARAPGPARRTPAAREQVHRLVDQRDQVVGPVRRARRGRAGGPPRRSTRLAAQVGDQRARRASGSLGASPRMVPASRSRSAAPPVNVIAGCRATVPGAGPGGGRQHAERRARRRCARRSGPGARHRLGQPGDQPGRARRPVRRAAPGRPGRRPRRRAAAARRAAAGRRGERVGGDAGGGDDAVAGGGQGRAQDGCRPGRSRSRRRSASGRAAVRSWAIQSSSGVPVAVRVYPRAPGNRPVISTAPVVQPAPDPAAPGCSAPPAGSA